MLEALPKWDVEAGVYCGAGSVPALIECTVWIKLFESARLPFRLLVTSALEGAEQVLAPSLCARLQSVSEMPSIPSTRAFGLLIHESGGMCIVGPPTETVWEAFESRARTLFGEA